MICRPDGTYEIEKSDISKVNKWVYKLLSTRATSGTRTFNTEAFIKYVYDTTLEKTNDAQKALLITRQVPSAIDIAINADTTLKKNLRALEGFTLDAIDDVKESFAESISAVTELIEKSNKTKNLGDSLKATEDAEFAQPKSVVIAPAYRAELEEVTDLVYTPLSTTGNEGIEGRAWYYGFIKHVADTKANVGGMSADGTASYKGVSKGIRITMVSGSQIPVNQLYEDVQRESNIEDSKNTQIFSVVTDADGNFVYFDDAYNVTDSEKGKLVYFPVRTVPSYKLEGDRKVFNLSEQTDRSVQSIEDKAKRIVKMNPLMKIEDAREQVIAEYQNAYRLLSDAVEYLAKNPSDKVLLNIKRINKGTLRFNRETRTPVSAIKNLGSLNIQVEALALSTGKEANIKRKYISISGIANKIPFSMDEFSANDAAKVGTFIVNDIYNNNGTFLSTADKYEILRTFVPLGSEGLVIDTRNNEIKLNGEVVDLTDKEVAATAIADFLTREIPSKDSKGEDIMIKNQYWFDYETYKKSMSKVNDFTLTKNADGTYNLQNNLVDYKEWLRNNSYTKVELDSNGEISQVNGYFEFGIQPDSQKKIASREVRQLEAPKSEGELTIDNLTAPTVDDKQKAIDEIRKRAEGRSRKGLFSMRHSSLSATNAQIKRGKKWFDKTQLTFKDSTGKTVTKPLSEIMPYEELFNVVNSNGDIRATWTRNGITLYNGSDYADLYHEAWHGFTQWFLNSDQKKTLYNEVKKLNEDIKYYDHALGDWKTINSKDLDFSKREHIVYAEEYLAEKFRKYAIDRSAPSAKIKSLFQKIWDALKALFSKTTNESASDPYGNSVINQAFDQLYTGNLVDYTFDQANIELGQLNYGITAVDPSLSNGLEGMDLPDSIAMTEGINGHLSDFIDLAVAGEIYGDADPAYASLILTDVEYKKDALYYAKAQLQAQYDKITETIDQQTPYLRQVLERRQRALYFAITQFGDIDDLANNTKGTLAFFNKRTGFLDLTLAKTEDDTSDIGDQDTDATATTDTRGRGRDGLSSGDGTEFSALDRMDSVISFAFSNIIKLDSKGKPELNRLGLPITADKRDIYNIVVSTVENLNDRTKMYEVLWDKSQEKSGGKFTPTALMLQQFLRRVGEPSSDSSGVSQLFWNKLFMAVRFDRVTGLQVNINAKKDNFEVIVGETDSSDAAIERDWQGAFVFNNPSDYLITDPQTNEKYLDLKALKEKYGTVENINKINPYEFFKDFGISITPLTSNLKAITESGIIGKLLQYRIQPMLKNMPNLKITTLEGLLGNDYTYLDAQKKSQTIKGQKGQLKQLLRLESAVNPKYTDYMRLFAGDARSERSNPSGPGNTVIALNKAEDFKRDILSRPELSKYNPNINPAVKTSIILNKMFPGLSGRDKSVKIAFQSLLGTQLLDKDTDQLISSIASSQSDEQVAYLRDFFTYALNGAGEAYKHADKNMAYIMQMIANTKYYIKPGDFAVGVGTENKGKREANKIITGYIASELERIKKVIASNEGKITSGEKASDIILYTTKPVEEDGYIKEIKYVTLADVGTEFTVFDDILTEDLKNELINNKNIQTVEDFNKLLEADAALEERIHAQLNAYFSKLIKEDRSKLLSYQLFNNPKNANDALKNIRSRSFSSTIADSEVFEASVSHFVYSSFIHKQEMSTLFYGDPVIYQHDKEEHMKRIPTMFATGRMPVTDQVMEDWLQKNPGGYYKSEFFKDSGLTQPADNQLVKNILNTAVLEDAIESVSEKAFEEMVTAYIKANPGIPEETARKQAKSKYKAYKNMKSADAQGWISFDAYRALEIRLDNWGPAKEGLYQAILRGEETDPETLELFFPIKKMQYAGALGTTNFAVNSVHKYSLMPLIPTIIKGTELEKLHNRMVSQNIGYVVMHSGSKVANLGTTEVTESADGKTVTEGKLNKFYTEPNGDHTLAFEQPGYEFTANPIYLDYFKEQLVTHDTQKGKVKFATQRRSLVGLGLMDAGVPSDFGIGQTTDERLAAWNALTTEKARIKASKNYALRQNYLNAFSELFKVATAKLKMELGYKDPNSTSKKERVNVEKLMTYIQEQFSNRESLNEYQLDFLQIGPKGQLVFPQDLGADPAQIEKLIASLVNKKINDQMSKGESFIQVSSVGFRKTQLRTDSGLKFYRVGPNGETLPMQVKIPLIGDFAKLLNHVDKDGKKIGTVERLNELIKDEEWLSLGDNRKMITMGGDRIPIQGHNSMEVMEVAEFLDSAGGNMMVLPLEIVAKTGGDFDIDKLICLIPVIKNNLGQVELSKPVKTRKLLNTIINEKAELREELKALRKKYIKENLTPEFRAEIEKLEDEQRDAQAEFNQNYINDYYVGGSLDKYINRINSAQEGIDALYDQLFEEKKEVFEGKFDEYIDEVAPINAKLRELNRQQDSFSPEAHQNNLMDAMNSILLRGDNFTNLTLPNDTATYTEKGGPVDTFTSVNRPYNKLIHKTESKRKKMSPTRIMENGYNSQKAFAMAAGKNGISIAAKTNKIFALYKEIGLHFEPTYSAKGKTILQRLLVPSNFITINGSKVISVGNAKDVNGNDISDSISQLMNGYLDVAKEDWVFDINAVKELEPEFLFLLEAGVGEMMASAMVSQPLVKKYVEAIRKRSNAFSLAVDPERKSLKFAKYEALLEVLNEYVPDLFTYSNRRMGENGPINPSNISLIADAQKMLGEDPEMFDLDTLIESSKNKTITSEDVKFFLHFMEVMELTKGDQELKNSIDIDTKQQLTGIDAVSKINGLKDLSSKFPPKKINELIKATYMTNFETQDLLLDAISSVLPLRGLSSVNEYLYRLTKEMNFEDKATKENFMRNFINELPLYISSNKKPKAVPNETTYNGYTLDINIIGQTYLKFGAIVDQEQGALLVDHIQIDRDFDSGAYSKKGYGNGDLALVPSTAFSGYSKNAARSLYRAFVYEREIARATYPYADIETNAEFIMFKTMRLEVPGVNTSNTPDYKIYEEFIRNKGLYNAGLDVAKFESVPKFGMFSMADIFNHIIKIQPDLRRDFSIIDKLTTKTIGTQSFLTLARKIKDVDVQSASVAEISDLMNPAIRKSGNESLNTAISAFFAKFPEMAFRQAGNNSGSGLYLGSIVDPKFTAVAEADNLNEYIKALSDPLSADSILDDFTRKFVMKAPYFNKYAYINYNSNMSIADFASNDLAASFENVPSESSNPYDEQPLQDTMQQLVDVMDELTYAESSLFEVGDLVDVYFKRSDSESELEIKSINKTKYGNRVVLLSGDKEYTYFVDNEGKGDKIDITSPGVFEITPEIIAEKEALEERAKQLWESYNKNFNQYVFVQGKAPVFTISPIAETISISREVASNEGPIKKEGEEETAHKVVIPGHEGTELYYIPATGKIEDLISGRGITIENFRSGLKTLFSNIEKGSEREKLPLALNFTLSKLYKPEEDLSDVSQFTKESKPIQPSQVAPTQAPVTQQVDVTPRNLIMNSRGPQNLVDYETGDLIPVAKVYNQNSFIVKDPKGNETKYDLSEDQAKAIMDSNPDKVFVFATFRPNANGQENTSSGNANRRAWRSGLATGQSYGFGTKTFKGTTPTDEQYENVTKVIDQQIEDLVNMRNAGKEIVFPSDGIGQNFMTTSPQIFVYLSKKLVENFGYRNPNFENAYLVLEPAGKTGLDYMQEFYTTKFDAETETPAQSVTDRSVIEHIRHCKLKIE